MKIVITKDRYCGRHHGSKKFQNYVIFQVSHGVGLTTECSHNEAAASALAALAEAGVECQGEDQSAKAKASKGSSSGGEANTTLSSATSSGGRAIISVNAKKKRNKLGL